MFPDQDLKGGREKGRGKGDKGGEAAVCVKSNMHQVYVRLVMAHPPAWQHCSVLLVMACLCCSMQDWLLQTLQHETMDLQGAARIERCALTYNLGSNGNIKLRWLGRMLIVVFGT